MPWRAKVFEKSRDNMGNVSVVINYVDTVSGAVEHTNMFVFPRETTRQLAVALIRAHGLVEFVRFALARSLDNALTVGEEVDV